MGRQTEATDQTAADYVEHALDDLNQARQGAQAETRAAIESAAERTREVLHDLKGDVTGRAEELRTRHKEQTWEWQRGARGGQRPGSLGARHRGRARAAHLTGPRRDGARDQAPQEGAAVGRLSGAGELTELAARSSPNRYQGRREVAQQIAEMDLRIRLVGNKGAVEGGALRGAGLKRTRVSRPNPAVGPRASR